MEEVTRREFMENFSMKFTPKENTSWRRQVYLKDADGNQYDGVINWDADDGYEMYWWTDRPAMAYRPEFAYILDSITNDLEKENA